MTHALRLGLIALMVILAPGLLAAYFGAFTSVTVSEGDAGPYVFVYREMTGTSMSQVGAITTDVNARLDARHIRRQPLDVFYPDGRAEIGFAVSDVSASTLASLPPDLKIRNVPAQRALIAYFPWRGRLSFIVGAAKTDPAFTAHRKIHGYAKTEAYMLNRGDRLLYFQPIR